MNTSHHEPHPCPRTGKCCGRCKLAIPGRAAHDEHSHHDHPEAHEAVANTKLIEAFPLAIAAL